ncbi:MULTISPECIES: Na+/H+ antiporter subunit G [Idiomarina]|jgi:multicomponent K+:H+ antiporter subunit G|uniref:Na+/H+ antiporter subunit G n=2 Tax=Idiomarina abyssalis TaxID=86102 RepID=A0A8I1G685_9GAMM|nr:MULTISPECIES: Na+/H+ antiporter subunit G [Idiomarina]RDX34604.1 Na+/H+ antiporter subunit G [Idiomarina sp. HD9-110m-PIT-SAG04]RDX34993.1 Na+/H+ antiporter subunit G [Idiomarina sp. HD9-110m-PIT-SAG05]KPD21603.1 cation:proton antiporter [Idiomarina abyssalis]MBF81696.1 Na+/H+ antiporter subunit G [Idiomarina sp.]MBH93872.1 Na+/H+ antiporter subunit G [Idiomarina sp.]|tara:strand:+ start:282 stop:674 length:393 start_codon:yes stop_codon:yes gene_type:complete
MDALNQLPEWSQWLAAFFILLGACFAFIGSLGLAILPDFFTRLHAPTKNTTIGIGGIVIATIIITAAQGTPNFNELLIAIFLFLTAPISAHIMAKAALHTELKMFNRTRDFRQEGDSYEHILPKEKDMEP